MEHSNLTLAKIPILDIGKFEQWKFRIQQYLQNEHYVLWEVIEFVDSYEALKDVVDTSSASEGSAKKKGRTVAVTTEDMQKRKNDVMARITLLLALPEEHQLRFSKYKTAQELWAAILKTFGEGKETLEQTFNRLQAIVSHLEFMDIEIEQDDLNQKLLTSLAPEWLMHTIVWRNRSDLDTMSLDDLYNHLKVYEPEKKTGKKIFVQGTDVAGFDKSKVECFNCHKMGHFAREWRAPMSQDRDKRENFKQGSKVEESALKALMAIDGVGWDWSYMANEEEDHSLVADQEASTEFALMAKSSSDTEVFDNSLCYKACKKNTDSLNTKITDLSEKLSDSKTMLYHYKLDDTITDYSRPSPNIESKSNDLQNNSSSVSENGESTSSILSKPEIKFVKGADSPTGNSQNVIDDKGYWNSGCSRHMTGNISYLSDYEPYDGGYVSFGQGGYKITGKGTIKTVAKASADKSELWHMRLGHLNFKTMNRVLVNNSQNKTPYELFNGRTPAIGFLKPFGCHVMILNTLDHLGKFEAKGDEGYFI
nr:ribonuclease H-like domain-containing protein [Tanacetum cinerariifolium]